MKKLLLAQSSYFLLECISNESLFWQLVSQNFYIFCKLLNILYNSEMLFVYECKLFLLYLNEIASITRIIRAFSIAHPLIKISQARIAKMISRSPGGACGPIWKWRGQGVQPRRSQFTRRPGITIMRRLDIRKTCIATAMLPLFCTNCFRRRKGPLATRG